MYYKNNIRDKCMQQTNKLTKKPRNYPNVIIEVMDARKAFFDLI